MGFVDKFVQLESIFDLYIFMNSTSILGISTSLASIWTIFHGNGVNFIYIFFVMDLPPNYCHFSVSPESCCYFEVVDVVVRGFVTFHRHGTINNL